jgi:type IX secretion system PorP/SprF family membrane protein
MNLNKYKILLLFTIYCTLYRVTGQDIHFTQFSNTPLNLNPANTGVFFGDYRLCLIDRDQWRSVSVPFKTISASFDTKLLSRKYHKDVIGTGIDFYRDKAGDSDFGTAQANLSMSYTRKIDPLARHFLSFGIKAGIAQRTIDYTKLKFDDQFNGIIYDPSISTAAIFSRDNFIFPDISAGIGWNYFLKELTSFSAGISIYHINKPDQSTIRDGHSVLLPRLSGYLNMDAGVTRAISLSPSILYLQQGTYRETDFGMYIRFIRDRSIQNFTSFNIGIFSRANDAVNIIAGADYRHFTAGISYDINYSDLNKASRSRGGYELSVIYRFFKTSKPIQVIPPCRTL